MLVTFALYLALGSRAFALTVLDATSPSIELSPDWQQEFSESTQGFYAQSDGFFAFLVATLPESAANVSYVGFPRARNSAYGYTLDCDDDCVMYTTNGTDPSLTDEAAAAQSTLFSFSVDPSTQHVLRVFNVQQNSEITFDHLEVQVQDNADTGGFSPSSNTIVQQTSATQQSTTSVASPTTVSPTSSASISSSSSSLVLTTFSGSSSSSALSTTATPVVSPSSLQSVQGSSSSASAALADSSTSASSAPVTAATGPSHATRNLAIALSIIAVIVVGVIISVLWICMRQRRQRRRKQNGPVQVGSQRSSLIPIMSPPEMRPASNINPFAYATAEDPFSDPQGFVPDPQGVIPEARMESPWPRRTGMESRSSSPMSPAPTIPLPPLPTSRPGASPRSEGLWIARPVQTPIRSEFAV